VRIRTFSEFETERLGRIMASCFNGDEIVFLIGDLGVGKTVLTRGIARGLGIKENIRSSSFILISQYKGEDTMLYHVDLYRLSADEVFDLGLEELIGEGVVVIEWADRISDTFPPSVVVRIELDEGNNRIVEITGKTEFLDCIRKEIERDAYFGDRHFMF